MKKKKAIIEIKEDFRKYKNLTISIDKDAYRIDNIFYDKNNGISIISLKK